MKTRPSALIVALGLIQGLSACGDAASAVSVQAPSVGRQLSARQQFKACDALTTQSVAPKGFSDVFNRICADLDPHHAAQDVIAVPGTQADMHTWYGYGIPAHTLAKEAVASQMDMCDAWADLGTKTTNDAGYINVSLPSVTQQVGRYDVVHTVLADGSAIHSSVWSLPAGTHIVIFDIDGTLTINNEQYEDQYAAEMFDQGYTPKAFAGAVALTKAWSAKGYVPVYVTGRPYSTADITRAWLDAEGFAPAPLHLTETIEQALPSVNGVGTYKANFFASLVAKGYIVDYAYGNEGTDVYAYNKIGVDPNHIFTIGQNAGIDGSMAIQNNYVSHLPYVATQPSADQPFDY